MPHPSRASIASTWRLPAVQPSNASSDQILSENDEHEKSDGNSDIDAAQYYGQISCLDGLGQGAGVVNGLGGLPKPESDGDERQQSKETRNPRDQEFVPIANFRRYECEFSWTHPEARLRVYDPILVVNSAPRRIMDGKRPQNKNAKEEFAPVHKRDEAQIAIGCIGEEVLRLNHQGEEQQSGNSADSADATHPEQSEKYDDLSPDPLAKGEIRESMRWHIGASALENTYNYSVRRD
jgi:hypothetical protein